MIWTLLLLLLLLPSSVGGIECNNLKRFRCKRGGKNVRPTKGPGNGCTWKRDAFKKYRHFPKKTNLFGICLNAGQSESEVFGTPAEQCDCGTKCKRKCTTKSGYKKKCYFAGPRLGGTCLPNRHFADSAGFGITDANFRVLTDSWLDDPAGTSRKYGNISSWDISEITKFSQAFMSKPDFNADLSKWDTSKVTEIENLFNGAQAFNGDLSKWNTSKVKSMAGVFNYAITFNADLSKWDTSEVTNMMFAFKDAITFNADLSKWNISKLTESTSTFQNAAALDSSNKPDGW